MSNPIRIANCSGFFGDRLSAAREMVEDGPIDVLTGDWLAELTMLILWKGKQRDPSRGWARTFLTQMEEVLGTCADRGIKVVTNAGGLNPAGLADEVRKLAEKLGVGVTVAHVEGDDLVPRIGELQQRGFDLAHLDTGQPLAEATGEVVTANAYLGAWPIVESLRGGADVVICPRVTDASLVVGPAAWHHGWDLTDWDRLAGAVAAGHLIECGPQVTGGNYAFFTEVPGLEHPGFPIAEVAEDGSSTITKHPGTGGEVSVGTVTAQLVYEIAGPDYANTDVVARFDTIQLEQLEPDRVRVSGTRGLPAPKDVKVSINLLGGWRNTMTFVLTGLDIEAKGALTLETMERKLGGAEQFAEYDVRLIRSDKANAPTNAEASAQLRITVKDADRSKVGRAFADAGTELALAGYPGFHLTSPPTDATSYGVFWPALVPAELVEPVVVRADGSRIPVPHQAFRSDGPGTQSAPLAGSRSASQAGSRSASLAGSRSASLAGSRSASLAGSAPYPDAPAPYAEDATVPMPLGTLVGARSGDKGGNANVGVWARQDDHYRWLFQYLTVERMALLIPEAAGLEIRRFELPSVRALNFVVVGLLGEGVASSTRPDPQAKSLGEYLRSRLVDIPASFLPRHG